MAQDFQEQWSLLSNRGRRTKVVEEDLLEDNEESGLEIDDPVDEIAPHVA
ncbi:MAG TPA: hypothetical protein VNL15_07895 [Dehalococcoidia bacterium]|nr:hypothetical protein [Dehalococcoidia bacterium]